LLLQVEDELNGLSGFLRELTIAYNYVLEAMCRWSKGCAGEVMRMAGHHTGKKDNLISN